MILFDLLFPGLGQYRRGERLVGLSHGVCAVGVVLFMYFSNQEFLHLHRDLRELVPRDSARELWIEKDAHKLRGFQVGLLLLLVSACDNWLATRPRRSRELACEDPSPGELSTTEEVI